MTRQVHPLIESGELAVDPSGEFPFTLAGSRRKQTLAQIRRAEVGDKRGLRDTEGADPISVEAVGFVIGERKAAQEPDGGGRRLRRVEHVRRKTRIEPGHAPVFSAAAVKVAVMVVAAHRDIGVVDHRARVTRKEEAGELGADGSLHRLRQILRRTEMQNDRDVLFGARRIDQIAPEFQVDRRAVRPDAVGDLDGFRIPDLGIDAGGIRDGSVGVGIPDGVASVKPFLEGFSASVLTDPLDRHVFLVFPEVVVPDVHDLFERPVGAVPVQLEVDRVQEHVAPRGQNQRVAVRPLRKDRVVGEKFPVQDPVDQSLHRFSRAGGVALSSCP